MDNFQIETAQNIRISQNVASLVDRILAFLIDWLVLVFYLIVLNFAISGLGLAAADQWFYFMVMGLPIFLYFLLWESFWNGRTPGKAAIDLRVVKLDGSKPNFSNYLVRWLLRIVDITISSGSVAVVTILLNGKGQRLGDLAAGTTVISEKSTIGNKNRLWKDLPENYKPTYLQVTLLSDNDMREIKDIFYTALKNNNHQIISKLAHKIAQLLEVVPSETPVTFIKTVIKDYNYYTRE